MNLPSQIAKLFRDVHFGGNWTAVNLKETVAGINWQQATAKVHSFNTIAALVFHMNYYVDVVIKILKTEPVNAHDKYSFDCPPIISEEDWQKLQDKTWADAETFSKLVEELPEDKLN